MVTTEKITYAGDYPATFILGGGLMELDQNKTFAELAIEGFGISKKSERKETEPIADYLLRSLEIDYSEMSDVRKNLLRKNFQQKY